MACTCLRGERTATSPAGPDALLRATTPPQAAEHLEPPAPVLAKAAQEPEPLATIEEHGRPVGAIDLEREPQSPGRPRPPLGLTEQRTPQAAPAKTRVNGDGSEGGHRPVEQQHHRRDYRPALPGHESRPPRIRHRFCPGSGRPGATAEAEPVEGNECGELAGRRLAESRPGNDKTVFTCKPPLTCEKPCGTGLPVDHVRKASTSRSSRAFIADS